MGWHATLLTHNHDAEVTGGGGGGASSPTVFTLVDPSTTPTTTSTTLTAPATTTVITQSEGVSSAVGVDAWGSYLTTLCDLLHQRLASLAGLFQSVQGGGGDCDSGSTSGTGTGGAGASAGTGTGSDGTGNEGSASDDRLTNAPLCHGVLLAIRYCLIDLHSTRRHLSHPTLWRDINQR